MDHWERTFAVNTRGVFLCYKYAGIQMIKQGRGGRIIGAASAAAHKGRGTPNAFQKELLYLTYRISRCFYLYRFQVRRCWVDSDRWYVLPRQ